MTKATAGTLAERYTHEPTFVGLHLTTLMSVLEIVMLARLTTLMSDH
jgi:hypothetical protein